MIFLTERVSEVPIPVQDSVELRCFSCYQPVWMDPHTNKLRMKYRYPIVVCMKCFKDATESKVIPRIKRG